MCKDIILCKNSTSDTAFCFPHKTPGRRKLSFPQSSAKVSGATPKAASSPCVCDPHMRTISISSFPEDTCFPSEFFWTNHLLVSSCKTRRRAGVSSGTAPECLLVPPAKELQCLGFMWNIVCAVTTGTAPRSCRFNEPEHTSHIYRNSSWNLKQIFQATFPKVWREGLTRAINTQRSLI